MCYSIEPVYLRAPGSVTRIPKQIRLEGLEPSESALAVFDRYAAEITIEDMAAEIRALNAREFRPVPVRGD